MKTKTNIETQRLFIEPLATSDAIFIQELLNSPGWLRFIGDRKIANVSAAKAYIKIILDNPHADYWVVRSKEEKASIGILTFIKRDYLEFHDFGFAFLPEFFGHGYAFESAAALLDILKIGREKIQAVTNTDNLRSIRLLEKLGFQYESEREDAQNKLLVYGCTFSEKL